jgi:hypothetical protein
LQRDADFLFHFARILPHVETADYEITAIRFA